MNRSFSCVLCAIAIPTAILAVQREMSPELMVKQLDAVINLKQLAVAMNSYAADFDGVYPNVKNIDSLKVVTYPYVKAKGSWKTANPKSEFRFNGSLNGVAHKDIKDPAGTVIFYESRPWPDGRRPVAYVDGSARLLAAHEWAVSSLSLIQNLPKSAAPLPESIGKTWKD